ncbi:type II toxin-antitoxin system HicA family toxin [Candidatus Woesearchaeota archaeon]|nr:type II toxin-antitoxin system HicA family toxin [Candidatus Woesearchaeota archaeon]
MGKLPLLRAKEFFKILQNMGFEKIRQEGSHVFFRHPDGRTTVVPDHPAEKLDRGLLNKIIKKDLQISRYEFLKYNK